MLVLGIETSCDETSCAVVKDGWEILSNVVTSSLEEHKPYGGVIPEIACRSHVESITPVLEASLKKAHATYQDIDLIAATSGPGLPGSLLVGVSTAKALSFARRIPWVGVDHLQAHLYACLMKPERPVFPLVGMVVSGGHTTLFEIKEFHEFRRIADTEDDACGEAFDKVAKILGLGYPGGPLIEQRAKKGNPKAFQFPPPRLDETSLHFSFSGIKTAVLYQVKRLQGEDVRGARAYQASRQKPLAPSLVNDIAASFQEVVIATLVEQALRACRVLRAETLVVGGGVIANQKLREAFLKRFREEQLTVLFPPKGLSLDNAAMVAGLGYQLYQRGFRSSLDLACSPLGMN